jgi:hypothetical protein
MPRNKGSKDRNHRTHEGRKARKNYHEQLRKLQRTVTRDRRVWTMELV